MAIDATVVMSPIEAILNVKARYCLCVDFQDWPAFGELFSSDAAFDLSQMHYAVDARTGRRVSDTNFSDDFLDRCSGAGGVDWPIKGRAAIEQYCSGGMASIRSSHHIHLPDVQLSSPTTASAVFPMEDWLWFDEGLPFQSMHGLGHYHETYVYADQRWQIQTLRLTRAHVEWK